MLQHRHASLTCNAMVAANAVLLTLSLRLRNSLLRPASPSTVRHRPLPSLQEILIAIEVQATRDATNMTFYLAEVAATRELFVAILDRIQRFGVPPPPVRPG